MPLIKKKFKFKKTKHNGCLAGKEFTCEVPLFDWEEFNNLPHAKTYVEKMYYGHVQQLVREEKLSINNTTLKHLQSMEHVISKFVTFSQKEVKAWCDSRDWRRTTANQKNVTELIMQVARGELFALDEKYKEKLVRVLAELCDKVDPVAEFLFVELSGKEEGIDIFG